MTNCPSGGKLATALLAVLVWFGCGGASKGGAQSFSSTSIQIAKELDISAGETLTLDPLKLVNVVVDTFTLGDNAVVRVLPATETVFIRAKSANIGMGARIEGEGSPGNAGDNAFSLGRGRKQQGPQGGRGSMGGDGPTIVLLFESHQIGNLTVRSRGGKGGAGGKGGMGSPSHKGICFGRGAIDGGPGGHGGEGGRGGRGGNVFVILHGQESSQRLQAVSEPGEGGEGGPGGDGAPGAAENRCGFHTRGGSNTGATGSRGTLGAKGSAGRSEVYFDSEDPEPVITQERLGDLIRLLRENGYEGNAEALKAVLDSGALRINYTW